MQMLGGRNSGGGGGGGLRRRQPPGGMPGYGSGGGNMGGGSGNRGGNYGAPNKATTTNQPPRMRDDTLPPRRQETCRQRILMIWMMIFRLIGCLRESPAHSPATNGLIVVRQRKKRQQHRVCCLLWRLVVDSALRLPAVALCLAMATARRLRQRVGQVGVLGANQRQSGRGLGGDVRADLRRIRPSARVGAHAGSRRRAASLLRCARWSVGRRANRLS